MLIDPPIFLSLSSITNALVFGSSTTTTTSGWYDNGWLELLLFNWQVII
jgi:hypothetical protein